MRGEVNSKSSPRHESPRQPPITTPSKVYPYGVGFCGISFCDAADTQDHVRRSTVDAASPIRPETEADMDMQMSMLRTEVIEHRRRLYAMEEHLKQATAYRLSQHTLQRPYDLSFARCPNPSRGWDEHLSCSPPRDLEEGGKGMLRETSGNFGKGGERMTARVVTGGGPRDRAATAGTRPSATPSMVASMQPREERGGSASTPRASQPVADPAKKIFDQDMLKAIYDRPYRKARQQGAMVGGGVLGLMSMPFGPIGMCGGGFFGAVGGALVGLYVDKRKERRQIQESEAQKKKLKCLVRWALDHFHEDDDIVHVIEMVCLEFKPMADIAQNSKHARKMLKLLDGWIAQKKVTRNLWVYMDMLLARWRELDRDDFLRSMRVFQTLTVMYQIAPNHRMLDEQEVQFLHRMQRLLEHESVKLVISHAQMYPTQNECKLMESMVYADALQGHKKRKTQQTPMLDSLIHSPPPKDGSSSPMHSQVDEELHSEDSEEDSDDGYRSAGLNTTPKNSQHMSLEGVSGLQPVQRSRSTSGLDGSKETASQHATPRDVSASPPPAEPRYTKVLKKPFFKHYQDFMDFDCQFKHKMPITLSEFELVRQKKDEDLKGWDLCVDRKEIRVAKIQNDTGCITLRAWATVPGVDLMVAFYLFSNHLERVKWDKVFAQMDVIGAPVQGSDVLYSLMKVPLVTPRDFLQYRRCRILEDGSIEIVLRSAICTEKPEVKGVIRAESYIAGYVLHQTFEGSTPVLNIFLMSCVDIKGLIPKWIINQTAPRKPAEWVETLKAAAMEYQRANPNYKEQLEAKLACYRQPNPYDYEEVLVEEDRFHVSAGQADTTGIREGGEKDSAKDRRSPGHVQLEEDHPQNGDGKDDSNVVPTVDGGF